MAVLGCRTEARLQRLLGALSDSGYDVTGFYEPDLDFALTAIAVVDDGLFKNLKSLPLLFAEGGETNDNDGR